MQKAIFIGVDGATLDKLATLKALGLTPGLDGLNFVGSYAGGDKGTVTQQPTVSGPGWSSLLTGVWANEHGVTENDAQPIAEDVPSIFELVDAAIPNATIASIVDWADINTGHFSRDTGLDGVHTSIVDYEDHGIPDTAVTDEVVDLIGTAAPDFTFVHLDEVDGAGHSFGYGPQYNAALIKAAQEIGEIRAAVAAREAANPDEDWLVVVSTDHGRESTGFGHGGQSDGERQTFIAADTALQSLTQNVGQTSVVPTILDWLGIAFDPNMFASGSVLAGAGDPIAPTLAEILTPHDDATIVPTDTDLSFRFSEAVVIGAGAIHVIDAATGVSVEDIDVASSAVTINGDTVGIDLSATLATGTEYYVNIDAGAFTDGTNEFDGILDAATWNFTTDAATSVTTVFQEDWEELAGSLQPFVSPSEHGGDGTDWTATPPTGWTVENNTPAGGPVEFFGWTFVDVNSWITTSDDQRRSEYTNAHNVVAVADPDEYDDIGTIEPDQFDSTLVSPTIDLSGTTGDTIRVTFDSSWRPEDLQEVAFQVSFDGGARQQVFHWTSNAADADFHPDATNEAIVLDIARPAGATSMQLAFDMPVAGNDWWWAVDNIKVAVVETAQAPVTLLHEDFEELAGNLDAFVSPTESGGDGTDWTATLPTGWSRDNTTTPTGGPAEFAGWNFLDKASWVATAGDQDRSLFTKGTGVVAVADPDEYDDGAVDVDPDKFHSLLKTAAIDLTGIAAGSAKIEFDSSWLPEDAQEARLMVSYDGAAPVELLRFSSDPADPDYKPGAPNETLTVDLDNPAGASSAVVSFEMKGGNDWWWAIDNIDVTGVASGGNVDPVAVADAYDATAGNVLTIDAAAGVLANDSDSNGDALAVALAADVQHGTLTLAPDGSFSYAADAGFTGDDGFTYTLSDGAGGSATGTVSLTVSAALAGELIVGTEGDDVLTGGKGDDTLRGRDGDDLGNGGGGNDRAAGGLGNDTLDGARGDDTVSGGLGRDSVSGGSGDDRLAGGEGSDTLAGDTGNDTLRGGASFDQLSGGRGDDTVAGGTGADRLFGDAGDDKLLGREGSDAITGGAGDDRLVGGTGPDRFLFEGAFGDDVVADFDRHDRIEFHGLDSAELEVSLVGGGILLHAAGPATEVSVFLRGITALDTSAIVFA